MEKNGSSSAAGEDRWDPLQRVLENRGDDIAATARGKLGLKSKVAESSDFGSRRFEDLRVSFMIYDDIVFSVPGSIDGKAAERLLALRAACNQYVRRIVETYPWSCGEHSKFCISVDFERRCLTGSALCGRASTMSGLWFISSNR